MGVAEISELYGAGLKLEEGLEHGYDIRTVQELLGYRDVRQCQRVSARSLDSVTTPSSS